MQFSSGPGTVELESVDFTSHASIAAGKRSPALQSPPAPISPPGPVPLEPVSPEVSALDGEGAAAAPPVPASPAKTNRADTTAVRSVPARAGAVAVAVAADPVKATGVQGRAKRSSGEVVALRGDRLVGWAELPEVDAEVLLFVDGRLIGSAIPAASVEALPDDVAKVATHGFAVALPTLLLDGADHQVSLRAATGERLGAGTKRMMLAATRATAAGPVLTTGLAAVTPEKPEIVAKSKPGTVLPITLPGDIALAGDDPARAETAAAHTRRIAVVSWDMAHNPVGRAFLLADMASRNSVVELVGPMFPMYGDTIWPPIAAAPMAMHAYPAGSFAEFVAGARAIAARVKCDVVHVGKARFSSLFIGAMIKQANACPMIVDVDDHELGFSLIASRPAWTI